MAMVGFLWRLCCVSGGIPPAEGEDPDYANPRAKIIARAPLEGVKFQRNNERLWDYLAEYFHGSPAFAWIKAFMRRNGKDGRGAWQNVYAHYCGDQQLRRVHEEAMRKVQTMHYEGEKRHFGYEKYCRAHVLCHADLERTSADGRGLSEEDKCMYFIDGLRHPVMAQAKAAYHARMPGQLDTFHALEQFCGTFIASIRREDRNVATVATVNNGANNDGGRGGGNGRGAGGRGGRGRGNGRGGAGRGGRGGGSRRSSTWLPWDEFQKLSAKEQEALKAKRAAARAVAAAQAQANPGNNNGAAGATADQPNGNGSGATTSAGMQMNQRGARAFSSNRLIASSKLDRSDELSRFELDSHADTCCFGSNCIFFNQSNVTVDVTPFLKGLGKAENVLTGSCAVAYDDLETGEVVILVFNQVIYFGDRMDGALGCPNQLRLNGLIVRDCPRHLDPAPDALSHTIQHPAVNLVIPLSCDGVISYFVYRKPTAEEFCSCPKIEMTSDGAVWDPYSPMFAEQELAVNPSMVSFFRGDSLFGPVTTATSVTCDLNDFVAKLPFTVRIDSLATGRRKGTLTPEILANRWHISLDRAAETLEATTHLAVREWGPNIPSIRLRPLSRQLQFRHLALEMFVDLAKMNVTSLRGNLYALVVCTSFGWTRVFPLKKKSDAHEGLDLLHRQVGVPAKMIGDGGGEFMKEFAGKA
jgi:hypothetical protein